LYEIDDVVAISLPVTTGDGVTLAVLLSAGTTPVAATAVAVAGGVFKSGQKSTRPCESDGNIVAAAVVVFVVVVGGCTPPSPWS
jgi:sulfur carrier protein ThiS